MARLYIVSTPIGNLEDTTHRAVRVLGTVDRVLAEDTRRTAILLRHYGVETPLVSLHAFNEAARVERILDWLNAGDDLAIVSDAGTPLLSDPGARIVQHVVSAGHDAVPVPGPSAVLAALVASGVDPEPFTFYGFTPRVGGDRSRRLDEIAAMPHATVLFEAPNRLVRLLRDLEERCGPERRIVVARELTKVHETFWRGTLGRAVAYYEKETPRGECTIVLAGAGEDHAAIDAAETEAARLLARSLLDQGSRTSAVARELARRLGVPRNRAYDIALSVAREREGDER
ncbi:MAG: 16S rRNA (cytidine(1402)-2'-O)-methyltransferase [Gemmatimonadota bacterium]